MSSWFDMTPKLTPIGYARDVLQVKVDTLPIQPIEIAERLGIITDEKEFPDNKIDGFYMKHGNQKLISVNSRIDYEPRKRFTYAHEIGHATIKGHSDFEHRCKSDDLFQVRSSSSKEKEANEFASELLIPTKHIIEDVKRMTFSFETLEELANYKYETSLTSLAIRFVKECPDRCAVALIVNGIVKWGIRSRSFTTEIKVGQPVCENTYAWDFFNEGKNLDGKPEKVITNAWLYSNNRNGRIFERSKSMGSFGAVLSLLHY